MTAQVVIKSAAQNAEDFTLDCETTWTIAQIKDKLSSSHPLKPKREHQKLIYGGKLLPDHLPLKSVLNQSHDVHIIHLVCPPPPYVPEPKTAKQPNPVSATAPPPPLNPTRICPTMSGSVFGPRDISNITMPSNVWSAYPDPNQQYAAAQQMYMQMMSQYYAQISGSAPYGAFVPPMVQPSAPEPVRPNAPLNPQPRANDEEERDYIEYFYTISRVIMLAALLLYYSSATRVIAVLSMILILTIFAKLNRQRQREEMLRASARQTIDHAPQEQAIVAGDPGPEETEQATDGTSESLENESSESQERAPPTSVPSTIFTLVSAFFSSLIPTEPLPVNVN